MSSSPNRPRSRSRKNGEAVDVPWTAEQMSWTNPGRVSSALRIPPPTVGCASYTTTERPARARVIAAASPFGPDPTTIASGASAVMLPMVTEGGWSRLVVAMEPVSRMGGGPRR